MCIDTIKKDYLSFGGRLNRKAFIMRTLCITLIAVIIGLPILAILFSTQSETSLYFLYVLNLLFVWPSLSLYIRRLHDLNRSAWWLLLFLIPIVSIGMAIYILFFKGTTGTNNFGEDPLEASVVPSLAE